MGRVLTARLMGRFRLLSPDGQDLTPKSAKGQGLLALILTSPDFERGRGWLQDKLWSDRGPEQGARSLRQELSQIKKTLGTFADLLIADRKSIRIAHESIVLTDDTRTEDCEFLEGLDIRDDEFNIWLATERTRRNDVAAPELRYAPIGQSVALIGLSVPTAACKVLEGQLIELAHKSLSDLCEVTIYRDLPSTLGSHVLIVGVQVFEIPGGAMSTRITLERVSDAATLWSETINGIVTERLTELDFSCLQLINRLFENVCQTLARPGHQARAANSMAALGIAKCFTLDGDHLLEANRLFSKAFEIEPRGVFLAWQAQVMTIQFVERFAIDPDRLRERGERLCAEALRLDATNSNVLAGTANFRTIVERNIIGGLELARLAVRANPANPLAWWALSNAVQYTGDVKQAYSAATRATQLAMGTKLEFWAAFQRSLAAMLTGDVPEALRFGEMSSALAPDFRPPLRYLGALYAAEDDMTNGQRVFSSLEAREKDFTVDRMIEDPDYPVRLMRTTGLLEPDKIRRFRT